MPDYIASGKDAHAEGSVKVHADDDWGAFLVAKQELPIVTGLERIEADGSLTPITNMPFDDIRRELQSRSESDIIRARNDSSRKRKWAIRGALFLALAALIELFLHMPSWRPPPTTNPAETAPASQPG